MKKRSMPRGSPPDAGTYVTTEDAALYLSTTPTALRARCRRHARRVGKSIVAHLGADIIAVKLGASWRVRFPA